MAKLLQWQQLPHHQHLSIIFSQKCNSSQLDEFNTRQTKIATTTHSLIHTETVNTHSAKIKEKLVSPQLPDFHHE